MANNEKKIDKTVAFLALIFGTLMLLCSLYLIILNNYSSATGTVGLTGGTVIIKNENIWFELSEVTNGGKYGLIFGIVVGIIANSYQFMALVIRDKEVFKDNPKYSFWVNFFDIVSRAFDTITAFWYTTQGHNYFPNGFNMAPEEIAYAIAQLLFQLIIVVGFLTIGSEVFFAISLKLLFKYAEDGILSVFDMISGSYKMLVEIGNRIEDIGEMQMNREKGKGNRPQENQSPRPDKPAFLNNQSNNNQQKRSPGRPPKNQPVKNPSRPDRTQLAPFPGLGEMLGREPEFHTLED